jgi:hypothetical protein
MYRILAVLCLVTVLLLPSCTGKKDTGQTTGGQGTQQGTTTGGTATSPADTGTGTEPTGSAADEESAGKLAQEKMRSGDIEGAIAIIENMAATSPLAEGMSALLSEAHMQYAKKVTEMKDVAEDLKNEVLYYHYMRVLELNPANEEAQAQVEIIKQWYAAQGLTLPETIDPLKFIPMIEQGTAPSDTESTGEETTEEGSEGQEGTGEKDEKTEGD